MVARSRASRLAPLFALALLIPLALSLSQGVAPVQAGTPVCTSPDTFNPTGGQQSCNAPPGAVSVTITAVGGAGGTAPLSGAGGKADSVTATFSIGAGGTFTAGQTLFIEVGGTGGGGTNLVGGQGGGGASDVRTSARTNGLSPDPRVLVAGGGGGAGGVGGGSSGAGGNAGSAGSFGGQACVGISGSGGGGGYFGGGGAGGSSEAPGSGGGGGSDFPSSATVTPGVSSAASITLVFAIQAATTTMAANATAPFSSAVQGVTLTAIVTSTSTVNTGTVTFTVLQGASVIGSATPGAVSAGVATVPYALPAGQAPGVYTIQAAYSDGASFAASTDSTHTLTIGAAGSGVTLVSSPSPSAPGQVVNFTATVACAGGSTAGETVTFLDNGTAIGTAALSGGTAVFSSGSLSAGSHPISASYPGDAGCAAGVSNTVTQVVGVAAGGGSIVCTPLVLAPGATGSCTITFPSPLLPGTTITLTLTSPSGGSITGCNSPTGGLVCGGLSVAGPAQPAALAALADLAPADPPASAAMLTLSCPTGCTAGATVQIVVAATVGGAPVFSVTVLQPGLPPVSFLLGGTPVSATSAPAGAVTFCNNTALNGGLSQALGGGGQSLAVSGPATSFTLPLFGPASTCLLQPQTAAGGVGAVNCSAAAPCPDGTIIVTLSTPGSGAVLSCAAGFAGTPPVPVAANNGGACQPQAQGTQLNLPCGVTAGTPAASTTPSSTCTNVLFEISSVLGACLNTPAACINPGTVANTSALGLNTGTAAVTVSFLATPANGGSVGGVQLGTNSFSFSGPGTATLLVAASPQLIPSNGTQASVVSATFACTSGFTSVGGFPLANTTAGNILSVNSAGQLVAQSSGCGAGLPGTFSFSSTGPVLFDNGRNTEQVACGLNGNVNAFGNGSAFFGTLGTTYPLAFTCTGAAVLAIGAGVAGDAPVNVSYVSAVGGLQAVGSALLTVSPSGVPRLSLACSPTAIAAGSTGSLCTARVTDLNGAPLSGMSGATVTFTTSDPATTTILPCTIGTPGAITITTSPPVIPLLTPQTPCQTPSGSIPGQVSTYINGQAIALLVASSTAQPQVVTVTASLGVLIPPEYACLVAPYLPTGVAFGSTPNTAGYYASPSGLGIAGCGNATPVGSTGLATAFNAGSAGFTGAVSLPNATSAATAVSISAQSGIQIAGASALTPLLLARGCNAAVVTSLAGTPLSQLAARVSPAGAVVSLWRFDNGSKLFRAGWFADNTAPTDFAVTGAAGLLPGVGEGGSGPQADVTEAYEVCVSGAATMR